MRNIKSKTKKKKVKKFAAGGDMRMSPVRPGPMPMPMPEGPFADPASGGGATGYVEDISTAAGKASGELGKASQAIGGGGGMGRIGGGGNKLLPFFKKGGKVRGAGIAQKGVRACKMR
tara:strand:- start:2696 stop:3049 length:354 start_codon:yes stop_codon:yes gene_type:complete